jgi:uncharacterized protein (TIGR04255 family)
LSRSPYISLAETRVKTKKQVAQVNPPASTFVLPLPKRIDPCPIVDALVEVRFTPNIPEDAILGVLYESLAGEFPKVENLPALQLPPQIRNLNPQLRFQSTYRLRSNDYVIAMGPRVFSVGILMPYPGWAAFRDKLERVFGTLIEKQVVKQLNRLGLRYVNVFEGDVTPRLTLEIKLAGNSINGYKTFFRTILDRNESKIVLQVAKDQAVKRSPDFKRQGTSIDIDVSQTATEPLEINRLKAFIDRAHSTEKELFFELLRPELLEELHPVY